MKGDCEEHIETQLKTDGTTSKLGSVSSALDIVVEVELSKKQNRTTWLTVFASLTALAEVASCQMLARCLSLVLRPRSEYYRSS